MSQSMEPIPAFFGVTHGHIIEIADTSSYDQRSGRNVRLVVFMTDSGIRSKRRIVELSPDTVDNRLIVGQLLDLIKRRDEAYNKLTYLNADSVPDYRSASPLRLQFYRDGIVLFPSVVPEELRLEAIAHINTQKMFNFNWRDDCADKFQSWLRTFIDNQGLGLSSDYPLTVLNRPKNEGLPWHEDSSGGNINYSRRAFAGVYLTPTIGDRGALRIIPNSHLIDPATMEEWRGSHRAHPDEQVLEMPDGTVVVIDERMWHGAKINGSPESRVMVLWWMWKDRDDRGLPGW